MVNNKLPLYLKKVKNKLIYIYNYIHNQINANKSAHFIAIIVKHGRYLRYVFAPEWQFKSARIREIRGLKLLRRVMVTEPSAPIDSLDSRRVTADVTPGRL
jgi:hypothetical protein